MGVSILIGEADGTTPAAAIYSRSSGHMLGLIFEGDDAAEQAEAFLAYVATLPRRDVRQYDEAELVELQTAWRRRAADPDTGSLRAAGEEEVPA